MKWMAWVLLGALLLPGLIMGLLVHPLFFLLMLAAGVVPLYFLGRGVRERQAASAQPAHARAGAPVASHGGTNRTKKKKKRRN